MKPEELEDLVARYLADGLSEEEERSLLEHLERSPEALDAFGRELAVDRLLRENRKAPLAADRILRALPRGPRADFARGVMERLPAARPVRHAAFIPGLVAAGLLAALLLYAALQSSAPTVEGPTERASGPEADARREAREEQVRAEAERRKTQEIVAAFRRKEEEMAREVERAAREREEETRRRAEDEVRRLKTEREAEEAKLVEAVERERRAAAEVARPADVPPRPLPPPPKTETAAATLEKTEGRVTLIGGSEITAPRPLLAGQGIKTSARDGAATITFADRTQVILAPGTEIREVFDQGGKRLLLLRGRIDATVSKQPPGRPFILTTAHGEAKVLGTTLRLSVDAAGTRLDVFEGTVRLSRADGNFVDVTAAHSALVAPGPDFAAKPILDRLHYEAAVAKRPDLLFFEDFEQDGWKRHWSSPSETSRVTEDRASTLMGRRSLEVRLKAGEKGGDGWHRLTLPNGAPALHVRAYFYFPKDFDLGPAGGLSLIKLGALPTGPGAQDGMSLWADHRPNGRDFFSADLLLTNRWSLQFGYYHLDQSTPKGDWKDGELPGPIALKPGRWHSIELFCRANEPGLANGVLRAWIDGTLCNEEKGIRFRDSDALQLRELALTGGGSPSPRTQSYFVDDVVVAREYIGAALTDADGVEPRPKR
jgi:ferric-dicitrate binding protein FerR (iron transport regulator)